EPIALAPRASAVTSNGAAPHFVRAVLAGDVGDLGSLRGRAASITTTLDRDLQREVEVLARQAVHALAARHVSAAAVLVLENGSGDVLAWVGAPDIEDAAHLGHNDGVLARRQPGSALKPFVYELAMERLGFTAATVLPDVELHFADADGDWAP